MRDHRFEIKSVDMTATKSEETIAELVRVWESSVRATHLFLSESEIDRIKGYVPQALRQVQHLLVDSPGKVNGISGSVRKTCVKITFSARMQVEKL